MEKLNLKQQLEALAEFLEDGPARVILCLQASKSGIFRIICHLKGNQTIEIPHGKEIVHLHQGEVLISDRISELSSVNGSVLSIDLVSGSLAFSDQHQTVYFTISQTHRIYKIYNEIFTLLRTDATEEREKVYLASYLISRSWPLLEQALIQPPPKKGLEQFMLILRYLQNNYKEPITRSMISRHFSIPPGQVNRLFRKYYGLSFKELLQQSRFEYCLRQLAETDDLIKGIAHACGFGTVENFSNRFRDFYGVSPRQMRGWLKTSPELYDQALPAIYKRLNCHEVEFLNPERIKQLTAPPEENHYPLYIINLRSRPVQVYIKEGQQEYLLYDLKQCRQLKGISNKLTG